MTRPAYLIGQIEVEDPARYLAEYGRPLAAQLAALGAEVLASTPEAEVLEGGRVGNWTVILRFPSLEVARSWYASADYAPLKAVRIEHLTRSGSLLLLPGRDG